jgi:hypothetical protein
MNNLLKREEKKIITHLTFFSAKKELRQYLIKLFCSTNEILKTFFLK